MLDKGVISPTAFEKTQLENKDQTNKIQELQFDMTNLSSSDPLSPGPPNSLCVVTDRATLPVDPAIVNRSIDERTKPCQTLVAARQIRNPNADVLHTHVLTRAART